MWDRFAISPAFHGEGGGVGHGGRGGPGGGLGLGGMLAFNLGALMRAIGRIAIQDDQCFSSNMQCTWREMTLMQIVHVYL